MSPIATLVLLHYNNPCVTRQRLMLLAYLDNYVCFFCYFALEMLPVLVSMPLQSGIKIKVLFSHYVALQMRIYNKLMIFS